MLDGVLWVLCSGAAWRDMADRFGPWSNGVSTISRLAKPRDFRSDAQPRWTKSAFHPANVAARVNAANGYLPTRAMTPKCYAATAINIECNPYPAALDEAQTQAWLTLNV
ncbi:hypothetical protein [Pseudomonas oryzicola]|uniref:hypothetical protein n=1 Tax=Pseudomonas oryzicola TaxID=485876 RepID=UPI003461E9CA